MRYNFLFFLFCFLLVTNKISVFAQSENTAFAKESYEMVIPFQYDSLSQFSEGLAAFKYNGSWGFIDKTGKEIIPCVWKRVRDFSEGLTAVQNDAGKWGYIDKTGKEMIPFVWKGVKEFSEGLTAVQNDAGKWGYIDKNGREIIPFIWNNASSFSEGLAAVENDTKEKGFIDKEGKLIIPCKWNMALDFYEGVAIVSKIGNCILIDKNGEEVKMQSRYLIVPFSEGLAGAIDFDKTRGLKVGFIDKNGDVIVPINAKWKGMSPFSEGLAAMQNREKETWGYIDKNGYDVLPYTWIATSQFSEGLAAVQNNNHAWGYIDKTGDRAIPFIWKSAYSFCDSVAVVQNMNGKWGGIRYTPRPPRRMALIIGNWEYLKYKKTLRSPRKDVEDMYETLMQIGFEKPIVVMNASKGAMNDSIRAFLEKASSADVAVVYYTGHGLQYNKKNYLLPDDYEQFEYDPKNEIAIGKELDARCVIGQEILANLDKLECKNKFFVMDACRDHSFGGRKGTSPEKFVKMGSKNGTCIVYATAEGTAAYDGGDGENSFFTKALLEGLRMPAMRFQNLFGFVEEQVKRESAKYKFNIQIPVVSGMEPVKNFIFNNKHNE